MKKFIPVILILSVLLSNCYSTSKSYVYGLPQYDQDEVPIVFDEAEEPQFESGEPYWIIDKLGHYIFSLLGKLILWNWTFANHDISEENKAWLKLYFIDNNLTGVKVRFNQYAPIGEFKRLVANERIHWSLKYTFGIINWLYYTLIPDRLFAGLFGGDHYNQFSNTVNVYSGSTPILLHEGGHAKDFEMRTQRSWYALFRIVPVAGPLYQEAVASDDAVSYILSHCDKEMQLDAYEELSPAYGSYLFSGLPVGPYSAIGVIPGHVYGYFKKNKERENEIRDCDSKDLRNSHDKSSNL